MQLRSEGEITRLDPAVLRRFVPALWAEWAALGFADDGRVLDPDTGAGLAVLRLSGGAHRAPGARYSIAGLDGYAFTLTDDDGDVLRGTIEGPPGKLRVTVGRHAGAVGDGTLHAPGGSLSARWAIDLTTGDGWRADGHAELEGAEWAARLTTGAHGQRWQLSAHVDVRALLLANDVPGWAVALVGGRRATLDAELDPSVLGGRGELLTGRVRSQRARADGDLRMRARSGSWNCRITLRIRGRGLIGRAALLAARPAVRRGVREALDGSWSDLAAQATTAAAALADLERAAAMPDGAATRVHHELWTALREAGPGEQATPPSAGSSAAGTEDPAAGVAADAADDPSSPVRRRRRMLPLAIAGVVVSLVAVIAVITLVISAFSSGGGGSSDGDADPTPALHIRQVAVAAFAGTDLQQRCATAAITDDNATVPALAAHDLTGRATGTIWNTASKATAPNGAVYDVFLLAIDLKPDRQHPAAAPDLRPSDALGGAVGGGWRTATELTPPSGSTPYPSIVTLVGRTLLIVRLDVGVGAAAELRRLTAQLTPQVRTGFLAATRP